MLEANMTNHKFHSNGNRNGGMKTAGHTVPSLGNRGDGPRTVPAPKPVPAPPKQK